MIRHYCDMYDRRVHKTKDDYLVIETTEGRFENGVLPYVRGTWLLCADCASRLVQKFEEEHE